MKKAAIAAFVFSLIGLGQLAYAIPMPPMATMTIEGTIEKLSWHAEQTIKGLPGLSGSAGAAAATAVLETPAAAAGAGIVTSGRRIRGHSAHCPSSGRFRFFVRERERVLAVAERVDGERRERQSLLNI